MYLVSQVTPGHFSVARQIWWATCFFVFLELIPLLYDSYAAKKLNFLECFNVILSQCFKDLHHAWYLLGHHLGERLAVLEWLSISSPHCKQGIRW